MRRLPLVLAVALALLGGGAAAARATAAGPAFVITGHGWGHGVGLSQYGAYGYAQHGWNYRQIVAHYFPGTALGPAPLSRVRVLLADGQRSVAITSPAPFKVRDALGTVHTLPTTTVKLGPGLKLKVDDAQQPQALEAPLTFVPGAAPLTFRRAYRGSFQVDVVGGKLRVIDVVALEQYLYGVVPAEMPYSWAPEALKAQAIAARSYALATRKLAAPFDLYPDTRSQMYLGIEREQPSTNAAVDATAGQVVLYNGQVATTFFYSTSGGRTASSADVWGSFTPYLVSVPDPYDTISPYHTWGPYTFDGAKLAKTFKVPGAITDVRSTVNSSGRVQKLTLVGAAGSVDVSAASVRSVLGLRSTWFEVGMLGLQPPAPATPVEFGGTVQLKGVARGIAAVALEQRPASASWQPVGPVAPAPDGTVVVSTRPTVTTDYRLSAGAVAAGAVRVSVAPRVRFDADTADPGTLRGLVRPVLQNAPVQIQRQNGTAWATIAKATVDANGAFSAQLQLATGTYRARVAPGRGFVPGTTPPLRVVGP